MSGGNLKPYTSEEARKQGAKGGIASGEARRRKAALKRALMDIAGATMHKGKAGEFESLEEAREANITADEKILLTLVQSAIDGDMKAIELYLRLRSGDFEGQALERAARIAKLKAETAAIQTKGLQEGGGDITFCFERTPMQKLVAEQNQSDDENIAEA